ncbi:hypothetical protein KAX75_00215 [candidate division WOR-3 bacterium]|nr:hypothetical protein [candidate division WOR-3 bacterium]
MYLVIIILNNEEILDDLLSILVELGSTDTTIVEGQSMGGFLAHRIPIFAGLRLQLGGKNVYSKIMFALSDDKDIGKKIIHLLKDSGFDFDDGMGRIIVVKIEAVFGEPQLPDLE